METKPNTSRDSVIAEIIAEVERATTKFPTWPTDPLHAFAVVGEEHGELQKEVLQLAYEPHKSSKESVRKEAVQLAAMSIRFLMSMDAYKYRPGEQHLQNNHEKSPSGTGTVILYDAISMQVCIPESWTDGQVKAFADQANPCGTANGWQIRKNGDAALRGDSERVRCALCSGRVHVMLDA